MGLRRVGDIHYRLGRLAKAQDDFEQAAERIQKLSVEFPTNNDFAQELALTYNNRANVERDEGRLVQAEQFYQMALRIFEIVVEAAPQVSAYRDDLAGVESNRGIVLTGLARMQESQQAY